VAKLARGADVLVSEVANFDMMMAEVNAHMHQPPAVEKAFRYHLAQEHLAPEEVGKMAQAAGVKVVILTHFSPGADGEADASAYTAGVQRYFKGTVIAGRDLFEYDLPPVGGTAHASSGTSQ
jgi:ribonuclease BN (tRNA processing enzyme)